MAAIFASGSVAWVMQAVRVLFLQERHPEQPSCWPIVPSCLQPDRLRRVGAGTTEIGQRGRG